jgi:hypothetical protein|tara:strand:- start:41 stop:310 length:270 start_codon:yes stop_codon:yes gene_type:complete
MIFDMEMIEVLVSTLIFIGICIALWKFHVPGTVLWGSIGIIVYLGFVVNEMSKGVDFGTAIWKFPIIGIAGLILLIVGLFISFQKRRSK